MDGKLRIKISIADRVYPLTVEPAQEEGLRSASKKIDAMIKQFEESYAVRDKQDVLAMCALQFACLLYTSPSPRDATLSRMPSSA